jgi:hypothetical protein
MLLRSSYGTPVSISDGDVLLDETSPYSLQYNDKNLKSGHFYYYALFVFSTLTDSWVQAATAQGLVLTDWGFGGTFFNWVPDWYLELDTGLGTDAQPVGPLVRYLNLLGYEMDWVRSEIESLILFSNVDLISGTLLPYLGGNYGMEYEPELGMTRSRILVKNAVFLYKNRGTLIGIAAAGSAFTGFGCEVLIGPNLEIQLDDSAFDRSTGHWQPVFASSSLSTIDTSSIGITPEHVSYDPAPALTSSGAEGYLPINNDNVLLIGTHSVQLSWAQLFPPTRPGAREGSGIANNPLLLFGGTGPGGVGGGSEPLYGDTWTWTGTNWQQLFPASSPSPRFGSAMVYDQHHGQIVLFGGQTSSTSFDDTWVWSGSTWTQKFPVNTPDVSFGTATAYDPISQTVIMFGGYSSPLARFTSQDTFSWDGTNWNLLAPATSPPERAFASMAYDPVSNRLILFGGFGPGVLSDTWAWTGTNWVLLSPGTNPPARFSSHMVSLSSSVLLFGGIGSSQIFGDTWSWNGTTWVQLFPSVSPVSRADGMMVVTPTGDVLLFGGNDDIAEINDTWVYSILPALPAISTCTPQTATTLGIPISQQATPPMYVVSAYFRQLPEATPVARQFFMEIDWYDQNGVKIGSTTGASITDTQAAWLRASVAGSPPSGAYTFGRTVKSPTIGNGDMHLMDAEQVEVNTQATPGPTSWQPPRDIKICLLPVRQNLVANPVGLGGAFGWTLFSGGFVSSTDPIPWPAQTDSGFKLTRSAPGNMNFFTTVPVNGEVAYTFSCYLYALTQARTVNLLITFSTATGAFISNVQTSFTERVGSFVRGVNLNVTAPANAATATPQIIIVSPGTAEVHYVGGVMFEPLSYLSPYFDGNFSPSEDYRFEGTPNQSISDYYPKLSTKLSRLVAVMPDYVPIGSTFSLVVGAAAFAAIGKNG